MDHKDNRLYFCVDVDNANFKELLAGVQRLVQAEAIAETLSLETDKDMDDFERRLTLFVPTSKLLDVAIALKAADLHPGCLDVYDGDALPLAEEHFSLYEDFTNGGK